jgi:arylsulfatase A-like enzyme
MIVERSRSLALLAFLSIGIVSAEPPPNILFVLTDDQASATLGCYGNEICATPHIDRLAAQGIRLTDAHHMGSWSTAVCLPSRTMIMTGRSLWRIPGGDPELTPREAAATSLPALFREAGYDTFRTSKTGTTTFQAANGLFEEVHDTNQGRKPEGSRWHADRAIEFLENRAEREDEDPFFLFLGFSHPHDPRMGLPDLLDKYGAGNYGKPPLSVPDHAPPLPVSYLPSHPFPHGHADVRDEVRVHGILDSRTEPAVRNQIGRDYACIENLDRELGRVLTCLEETGFSDHTYVFFTSDHGIAVGRHGLNGKQNLYEHSWKVPFLATGPGIPAQREASGFIYLMDLLPTFCDLAGIPVPGHVEGKSFRSVLEGDRDRIRDQVYGAYAGGSKPGIRSLKTADGWKLIQYDVNDGEVRRSQLFHLPGNPHELLQEHHAPEIVEATGNQPEPRQIDLSTRPEHAAKRAELEALLQEEMRRWGDPHLLWYQEKSER